MLKITLTIFILLLFHSLKLNAQNEIPDSVVHERIQCIQKMLTDSKPSTNLWWYGWLGIYSAATLGQGALFLTSKDPNTKQDMALGTSIAFIGAAIQAIVPLNTGRDGEVLSQLPENTNEEMKRKLSVAEDLLKSDAMKEKLGRSWQIHALNEAVNLSSGLIVWLGYKRTIWDGIRNFLLNSVITETQIWTQPTRTLKDYQNYCRKYKSGSNPLAYQPQPEFFLSTFPGGASLRIVF